MQGIGWELCVVLVIIQKKRSEVVNPVPVEFLIVCLHWDTSLVFFLSNLSCMPNVDLGFSCQHSPLKIATIETYRTFFFFFFQQFFTWCSFAVRGNVQDFSYFPN